MHAYELRETNFNRFAFSVEHISHSTLKYSTPIIKLQSWNFLFLYLTIPEEDPIFIILTTPMAGEWLDAVRIL